MKHFLGGIVFVGVVAFASLAEAQGILSDLGSTTYEGGSSSTFENSASYSNGAPGPTNGPIFQPSSSSTVITITQTQTDTIPSLALTGAGTLQFVASGNTLTVTGFTPTNTLENIAVNGGATFSYSGGNLIFNDGVFQVGDGSGSGTLNIANGTLNYDQQTTADDTQLTIGDASTGTVNQSTGSVVTTGDSLFIGSNGGTGTYNLTGNAVLQSGTNLNNYFIAVGSDLSATTTGTKGILNISNNSSVNLGPGTGLFIGEGTGTLGGAPAPASVHATGVVTQSGSSTVSLDDAEIGVGEFDGATGTYNLQGGTLQLFDSGLVVGDQAGATGIFNQSGGVLTSDNNSGVLIAISGTGVYNLSGGTATLASGLTVGALGTVNQTGGILTVAGSSIDLSTAGGSFNLRGGMLTIGPGGLFGTTGEGKFNLAGGTLSTTGSVTDALDGILSGNSTINATGTVTFTGDVKGNGALTVAAGTVQASSANFPQIGGVTLRTGATLDLTTSGKASDTFAGTITGTGNLQTGNAGVDNMGNAIAAPPGYSLLLLKPVNLPAGTTTIAANTRLEVASGTLNTVNGATTSRLEVGGVAGGALTVNGVVTVGTVAVDSGSALRVGNVVGQITNNGALGTLMPEGTLTITGNLNQPAEVSAAQEGALLVRTNGTTADTFMPASATLFGTVRVMGAGSNTYQIVKTDAPGDLITGALNVQGPGGLAATPDTPLFTSTLSVLDNQILQLTTVQHNVTDFALTPNQRAVGNAIDTVIQRPPPNFVPLLTAIDSLSASSIPGALDQLTPESYLYMRDIAFENTTFLAQRVGGFLTNLRNGYQGLDTSGLSLLGPGLNSRLGQSLGSLLAYNDEGPAPNGVNYYPDDGESSESSAPLMSEPGPAPSRPATISDTTDPRMAPTEAPPPSTSIFDGSGVGFNEFLSGNAILGELNQDNSGSNQPKSNYVAGDVTAGVSFRMTSNLAAGVLFDYNHTDALTSTQGSHVRVDSYSPGIFGTFFEHGFYANGLFTFGYNNYSNDRKLSFGGTTASASSRPDGEQYAPSIDVGYDFYPDKHWVIGPTAGIGYTHLDVDSFHETGAGPADLAVDDQSADSLRARIGGRVEYLVRAGSILFQPHLSFSYQHEFLNDPYTLSSQLNIPGTPAFATQGSNSGRDTGLFSFGLTASLDSAMVLYLNYLAEYGGDDYFVQSVEGGLKASF